MLKTHGRACRRGLMVQTAVRPVMIIVRLPMLCNVFRLIDTDRPCDNWQARGVSPKNQRSDRFNYNSSP